MATDTYFVKRIEMMQEELEHLKRAILKSSAKKSLSLRGIWKGVDIPDEEIEEVKHSWIRE